MTCEHCGASIEWDRSASAWRESGASGSSLCPSSRTGHHEPLITTAYGTRSRYSRRH